jgi:hypothetical protein
MSDSSYGSPRHNGFIPLTLLAVSFTILLGWQIFLSLQARANARAQFEQRKQLVDQSTKVQGGLEVLVNDLLTLAETDRDAKAIVDKYQIRRNPPASAPAAK